MEIGTVKMPATSVLDRIAETAFGAKTGAAADGTASASGSGSDFASLIQQSLTQVNGSQAKAESMTHQYQLGQNDVSLEDAMISMQKANISFQTTVQVRNKLVTAYNDIMNMQL